MTVPRLLLSDSCLIWSTWELPLDVILREDFLCFDCGCVSSSALRGVICNFTLSIQSFDEKRCVAGSRKLLRLNRRDDFVFVDCL